MKWRQHLSMGALIFTASMVQYCQAEDVPRFRQIDTSAAEASPQTFRTRPVELSRSATVLTFAVRAGTNSLVCVDADGQVVLRSDGEAEPKLLTQTKTEPACATMSSDGKWLAYADAGGTTHLLDLATSRESHLAGSDGDRAVVFAFSRDAKYLAEVSQTGEARIWSTETKNLTHKFNVDPGPVQSLAFSPKARQIAIASFSAAIRVFNLVEGDAELTSRPRLIATGSRVTALAYTPGGNRMVVGTANGSIRLFDGARDETISIEARPFAVWSIAFDSSGKRMAAGSWDGTIRLWETKNWQPLQSVKQHDESVTSLAFDDRLGLVSSSLDRRLLLWPPEVPMIPPSAVIDGRDSVWVSIHSPDGKNLFVGGREKRFELWDVAERSLVASREGHPTTRCAAFSPDGRLLVTGGDDGKIFVCDGNTAQIQRTLLRHPGAVSAVVFADGGATLVSACDGGIVKFWDIDSGIAKTSRNEHKQQIYCAAVSPDEKWLVTAGGNWTTGDPGEALVWNLASGEVRARVEGHKLAVWSVVFMPDGNRFASSDSSGAVHIWNMKSLAKERTLQHSTWVRPLAISPDGKTLAVGRGDGSLRLWDTTMWKQKAACNGHDGFAFHLQFGTDGRFLTSSGNDGTVRIWHVGRSQ